MKQGMLEVRQFEVELLVFGELLYYIQMLRFS